MRMHAVMKPYDSLGSLKFMCFWASESDVNGDERLIVSTNNLVEFLEDIIGMCFILKNVRNLQMQPREMISNSYETLWISGGNGH